ncbi:hypothetical protein [Burkholderia sp. Ac-20344]|uniref:hypothetical protein n=1 Tax=Burkholderia sp. Ac-20344 TaxID=2703890 RepID=UPI001F120897|nr:hypothetical protein [Burkholderia sp. Ac-20344]
MPLINAVPEGKYDPSPNPVSARIVRKPMNDAWIGLTRIQMLRISANVTADFGNVTDSAGLGVARC